MLDLMLFELIDKKLEAALEVESLSEPNFF